MTFRIESCITPKIKIKIKHLVMPTQLIKWEENKPFSMLSPLVQEVELDLNIRNALSTEKSQQYKNKSQV